MNIRNNLLKDLKQYYIQDLISYYDTNEAEQLLTILIEHYFGISRVKLIMSPEYRLMESEILKLHMAVKELKKLRPVQYITGEVEFQGLNIRVSKDVLIPRPETEELVQLIVKKENKTGLSVIDIGTGSGCIAVSLYSQLKKPSVFATDISVSAIKLANENAVLNNAEISFIVHDILSGNALYSKNIFDIIVSNPPYVTQEDKSKMQRNVIDYEPHNALFVPSEDPLIFYEAILKFAEVKLKNGGRIYTEINESFGSELVNLFNKHNYSEIKLVKDIHHKYRFIYATKK